jgi:hypothetical protein
LYVIDPAGKLAYVGAPGPRGFQPADISPVLKKLLSRKGPEVAPPPRRSGGR